MKLLILLTILLSITSAYSAPAIKITVINNNGVAHYRIKNISDKPVLIRNLLGSLKKSKFKRSNVRLHNETAKLKDHLNWTYLLPSGKVNNQFSFVDFKIDIISMKKEIILCELEYCLQIEKKKSFSDFKKIEITIINR